LVKGERRWEEEKKALDAVRLANGPATHLRALHYLCVDAQTPVFWPDGKVYENTEADWMRLVSSVSSLRVN
jgi:hypothetical protein